MGEFLMMNNREIRQWLDDAWKDAVDAGIMTPDPEIDALVNSNVISIRYAVLTQILGKIADHNRSVMALQSAEFVEGAWDARSFATRVIVPWDRDNQRVIGNSSDPYVSNPLRRPRLDDEASVRDKEQWDRLAAFLSPLDAATDEELQATFRRVLMSLVRRLAQQSFSYPIPQRVSQHHLENLVEVFLSVPSGGLRPLAVSAALFKVLGEGFSLFSDVRSQGINEADVASGMPGDITCYDHTGQICLAVEVKDVNLTLAHVQEASRKARQSGDGLSNFLFAVPGVQERDSTNIMDLAQRNWAAGLNLYSVTIQVLIGTIFVLLEERWRVQFLREVGRELDERQNQPARRAWHDLLSEDES